MVARTVISLKPCFLSLRLYDKMRLKNKRAVGFALSFPFFFLLVILRWTGQCKACTLLLHPWAFITHTLTCEVWYSSTTWVWSIPGTADPLVRHHWSMSDIVGDSSAVSGQVAARMITFYLLYILTYRRRPRWLGRLSACLLKSI